MALQRRKIVIRWSLMDGYLSKLIPQRHLVSFQSFWKSFFTHRGRWPFVWWLSILIATLASFSQQLVVMTDAVGTLYLPFPHPLLVYHVVIWMFHACTELNQRFTPSFSISLALISNCIKTGAFLSGMPL